MDTGRHKLCLKPTMRWQALLMISWQLCLSEGTKNQLDLRGLWGAACTSPKQSAGNSSTPQCNGKLLSPSPGTRRTYAFEYLPDTSICQNCASLVLEILSSRAACQPLKI